ncbi:MAG: uracil-DNA glycosylase [bacterium]|nr:MAG: uracil-DNA glycosylase [bacterium]
MESSIQDGIANLFEELKNYLYSQQELYGDDIYLDFDPCGLALTSEEKKSYQLQHFYYEIKDCKQCGLANNRTKLVFGSGNPNSKIMLIGEAPGFNEDREGKPFVGNAGQLLDKILKAIHLSRNDVFITNVVKCHPPQNRDPLPEECEACNFILKRQLEIIEPQFILILGRIAAKILLETEESIANLRGRVYQVYGAKAVVTYHPAALLRNTNLKRHTWEDVQIFQKLYQ